MKWHPGSSHVHKTLKTYSRNDERTVFDRSLQHHHQSWKSGNKLPRVEAKSARSGTSKDTAQTSGRSVCVFFHMLCPVSIGESIVTNGNSTMTV